MNDYYTELIRMKPINCDGLIIYPVSFGEICDNVGLENFDKLLMPFLITKECLGVDDEEKLDTIDLFENVIMNDRAMLHSVAIIFEIFCKAKDILRTQTEIILKFEGKDDFIVNKDNFEKISQVIGKINGKDKIKVEKPPKNMSDRQRDVWEKLQAGRKKENEKNRISRRN